MTLLWIVLTAMTSVAAVLVAAPFLRRMDERRSSSERELAVYRDQLAEVEREAAAGVIGEAEAAAASQEIKRRLLAADRAREAASGAGVPLALQNNRVVIAIAGFVVLGSTILYAVTGRPDLPSASPGAAHRRAAAAVEQRQAATTQATPQTAMPSRPKAQRQGSGASKLGSVDQMIARVRARVQKNPADAESWRMLGWSYAATERYPQAVEAYAKAVELKPDNAKFRAAYNDIVAKAKGAGTKKAAAPGLKPLKLIGPAPQAKDKGPTAADVRAAGAMKPEARQAMIRNMVEGLAGRLEKSPRDGDGWIKLIRARKVLGEIDAARAALGKAIATFADTPAEQKRIRTAARALGVEE